MKTRFILFIMAAVAMATVSCKPEPSLIFSVETLNVTAKGGTFDIDVTANYAWSASSDDKWIAFNNASAGESGKLTVRISPNNATDPRTGTIKVVCEGLTKTIQVEQEQKNVVNSMDGDPVSVSWEQQSFEVKVETNVDFTVTIDAESNWLSYVKVKSLTQKTIEFTVQENPGTVSRDATVTFTYNNQTVKTLTITQAGHPQVMIVRHTLSTISVPVLFGFTMSGTVYWGDGASAPYASNLSHTYSGSGPYELKIEATGASTASMSNLIGVEKVDLSQF